MRYLITSLLILCAVGCGSGLSSRETRTQSYSSFILSLYDTSTPQQTAAVPTLPMKIAGAQIDTRSGSIVFIASADTEKTGMATASNRDGEVLKVLENARESLNIRLADQLAQRCQEIALTRPMPYGN